VSAATDPQSDGRYSLVRELARGGMGRIWIADDLRLSRRVALKELIEASATRALRFERELALTSRLDHPSIVSIHDSGTWRDGKRFYVMRLVTGESLEDVVERTRDVAERIALLPHGIAVVDALAYAHAQGIVHRDVKPDNILVGAFGETVVIDWGLAKDLRATAPEIVDGPYRELAQGATLGGEVLGTPAYIPPEQANGEPVDERADVYALGAVLYHMLSGIAPYRGTSVAEVLAHVVSGPPRSLAVAAPGVPPDLVTIVEKAMARDAVDRYANAGELASDLKRFQRGQLVAAHRYTPAQLVRRWLRKHRAAVTVGALAALALAAFAIASVARIVREQHEATAARSLAEHNRQLADERRAAAERLITFMLGDLRDRLAPLGKLAMLELPARKALEYYDARRELTPEERQSRTVALEHLGDALRGRGDLPGAEAQYRAAIAARAALVAEGHDRIDWHYLDAALHVDVADVHVLRGDTQSAIREYRTGIAAFAELSRQRPGDKRGPRMQVTGLEKLGGVLNDVHDRAGAEQAYRDAMAIAGARVRAAPDDSEAQVDLVGPEHGLGDALEGRGDQAGALAIYRATLARITTLQARKPDDVATARAVELTQHRIGVVLIALNDARGALQALRASAVIADRLSAKDPDNRSWQYERAINLCRLAQALQTTGERDAAIAAYRQAIAQLQAMGDASATRNVVVAQLELGELVGSGGHWPEAEKEFRSAVTTAEARAAADPKNQQAQLDLGEALARLGGALLEQHRVTEALPVFTRGLDVARALAAAGPGDKAVQTNLQQALIELADARCAANAGPGGLYEEALAISAEHLRATPGDAAWQELDADGRKRAKACKRHR